MLDEGPLAKKQLSNLRVYPGTEHPHGAQQPVRIDVGAMNRKNKGSA
jgi:large subunit ribosomal protein L13